MGADEYRHEITVDAEKIQNPIAVDESILLLYILGLCRHWKHILACSLLTALYRDKLMVQDRRGRRFAVQRT